MNNTLTTTFDLTEKKAAKILACLSLVFVVLCLLQDFLRADIKKTAYYLSESFMFSSFWWLFAPLLFSQYFIIKHTNRRHVVIQMAIIILPIVIHILVYPLLVWIISKSFYYHNFAYQQTLRYTLSEYVYLLMLFYAIPSSIFRFIRKNEGATKAYTEMQNNQIENNYINSILVSEGNTKRSIQVAQIFYFAANPPYVDIHLESKKYLHQETLKSVILKLTPEHFTRIHKSTIVNIKMVASYKTRLNGDYDLTLINNDKLRLSRNFASNFKNLYNKTHQFTTT